MRAANDVIWDWDAETNESEWSEALLTVLGWDPAAAAVAPEGTNSWWSTRVHPDDRERVTATYGAALADPACDHWESEYRFRRADGTWAQVVDRAYLVRGERGEVRRAVGAMQDVSARTAVLAALRESEARFRALIEASTNVVWRTDPEGHVTEDAPGWRALTGLTFDEIIGRGWLRAVHPDDVERSREQWRAALERRAPFEIEHRLRLADGNFRWFLGRGSPVLDEQGALREWVGMHQDVDDRHRREAAERFLARATDALNASLDHDRTLQALAELATEEVADGCVVHVVRPEGGFEVAALAARDAASAAIVRDLEARFPSPADAPVGHPYVIRTGESLLLPELDDAVLSAFATCEEHLALLRRLGMYAALAVPIVGHAGVLGALTLAAQGATRDRRFTPRELAVAQELGQRAGRALEHARVFRDTARARAEAEEASRAKSGFLAVLSHEIRTPLNAIVGYAHLLSDAITGPVTEAQALQLHRIVSSAEHLRVLIDEILTLSRMEAGREEVHPEPVDLCALVDEAMDIVALAAQAQGLRLVRDVPATGCVATTDRTKLLQAVVNLAGNAVKFTEHGEVAFTVRVVGDRAEIEVRDTGVGIAPEQQRRLYEPFWQADQRTLHRAGGTGLGLSVVRHVMQLLGGGVRAESAAGQGSRFIVWVPV